MLEFTCSTCGKHVQMDDSLAGKHVLCPLCGSTLTAPSGAAGPAASAGPPGVTVNDADRWSSGELSMSAG